MSEPGLPAEDAAPKDPTRTRILDAARDMFGSHGFDATGVRDIASRVGITDAALYHHFKSKREILNAAWDVPFGRGLSQLRPEGPLTRGRLDEITDASIEFVAANDNFQRLTYREILGGDQTALALRQQNRAVLRRTLFDHLSTVAEPDEAEIRTDAILALLTGCTIKAQVQAGPAFAQLARSDEFRERIRRWVATLAHLSEPAVA